MFTTLLSNNVVAENEMKKLSKKVIKTNKHVMKRIYVELLYFGSGELRSYFSE